MTRQDLNYLLLKKISKLALCLFLLHGLNCSAQKDSIDKFIEQQMQQQKIVGLSIGIVKNGQILTSKGYGYANLEYHIPASERTVYKLASVSKHIVATAIMLLAQEGKLKLTDPITKFFKDAPTSWNKITIRHLLNHTSGLQRESSAFQSMVVQTDSVLIRAAYNDSLVFPTGTAWQYCNLGYFMLADIIRQISGQSFSQFMKEKIFSKYRLHHTQTTSLSDIVQSRADGYVRRGGDTIINAENNIALRPSGAFLSNISDMLNWEMLMQNNQLLTKQNWQQMWEDTVRTPLRNTDSTNIYYGYGWNVTNYLNRKLIFHTGGLQGFRTIYYRFPAERTAIIILTNSEPVNTTPIAIGVAQILSSPGFPGK
jgi:CubicO group peptidase (beta-lactamase class C family)